MTETQVLVINADRPTLIPLAIGQNRKCLGSRNITTNLVNGRFS